MKEISKSEARKKIESFFTRESFSSEEVRKIRRLAMKHKIRLGGYRAQFCKKCFSSLKNGTIRVTKTHKITTCSGCGYTSKTRIF